MKPAALKKFLSYILIAIALGIIFRHFLIYKEEIHRLTQISFQHQILLIFIYLLIHQLSTLKIFIFLKKLGLRDIKYLEWFKIFIVSRFANLHVTQGANIYRSIKLKKEYDFSYTKSVSLIAVFTWFECVIVLMVLAFILLGTNNHQTIKGINILSLTFGMIILFLALPFVSRYMLLRIQPRQEKLIWLRERIKELIETLIQSLHDYKLVLIITLISSMTFCILSGWIYICFDAIGTKANLTFVAIFTTMIIFSRAFNIVPGNIGLRELLCGYLGQAFGWGISPGIIVSGIIRIVEYLTITVLGITFARTIFIRKKITDAAQ